MAAEHFCFLADPAVLVVRRNFEVWGDGVANDTAALQRVIGTGMNARKTVVYLQCAGGGDPNWFTVNGEVRVHGSVWHLIGLGFDRVIGGPEGRFVGHDAAAPLVKFQRLQAFGGRPPAEGNRSRDRTLIVESCDLRMVGAGGGNVFCNRLPVRIRTALAGPESLGLAVVSRGR